MDSELIKPFRVGDRYAACIPDTSTHKTASTNLFGLPPSDFNCLNVEKQWFLPTNPLLHNISEFKHGGCSAKKNGTGRFHYYTTVLEGINTTRIIKLAN